MPPQHPPWTRSDVPMSLFSPGTALVPHRVNEGRSHRKHSREPCPGPLASLEKDSQNRVGGGRHGPQGILCTLGPCRGWAHHSTLVPRSTPAVPCPPRPAGGQGADAGSWLGFWVGLSVRKKDTEAG